MKLLKASEEKKKSNHLQKMMKAAHAMSVRNHDMFEPNGINHRLKSWKAWSQKRFIGFNFHLPAFVKETIHYHVWRKRQHCTVSCGGPADMLVKLTKSALEAQRHSAT